MTSVDKWVLSIIAFHYQKEIKDEKSDEKRILAYQCIHIIRFLYHQSYGRKASLS